MRFTVLVLPPVFYSWTHDFCCSAILTIQ